MHLILWRLIRVTTNGYIVLGSTCQATWPFNQVVLRGHVTNNTWQGQTVKQPFKGTVKRAEPCKCDILLVSRILSQKRLNPSLKEWKNGDFDIWHSPATFRYNCSLQVSAASFQWRLLIFIGKKLVTKSVRSR